MMTQAQAGFFGMIVIITIAVVFLFSLFYGEDYAKGCESLGYTTEAFIPIIKVHECREIIETEKTVVDRFVPIIKVNGIWKEKVDGIVEK